MTSTDGFARAWSRTRPQDTVNGRPVVDAPVPRSDPAGVAPVDRVAGEGSRTLDAGPVNSTPFSNAPSGTLSAAAPRPANADRVDSPAERSGVTPNLGK